MEAIRQYIYYTTLLFWLFNNKDKWRYLYNPCIAKLLWLAFQLHTDTDTCTKYCVTSVRLSHRWELKMLFIYHIECNGKVGYNKISYTINGIFSISFYLSKIVFVTEARRYYTLLSRYWKNRRRKNIYNQNNSFSSENIYVCVPHNAGKMTFSLIPILIRVEYKHFEFIVVFSWQTWLKYLRK